MVCWQRWVRGVNGEVVNGGVGVSGEGVNGEVRGVKKIEENKDHN